MSMNILRTTLMSNCYPGLGATICPKISVSPRLKCNKTLSSPNFLQRSKGFRKGNTRLSNKQHNSGDQIWTLSRRSECRFDHVEIEFVSR